MSSKTISIELDVYRRLNKAKQARGLSFSELLRTIPLPAERAPVDEFLSGLRSLLQREPLPEETFKLWERGQREDAAPEVSH